jgi:hypothetical protein
MFYNGCSHLPVPRKPLNIVTGTGGTPMAGSALTIVRKQLIAKKYYRRKWANLRSQSPQEHLLDFLEIWTAKKGWTAARPAQFSFKSITYKNANEDICAVLRAARTRGMRSERDHGTSAGAAPGAAAPPDPATRHRGG